MSLSYESSGVRYDQLDAFKRACQQAARKTSGELKAHGYAEPATTRGESAYLIEGKDHFLAHVEEAPAEIVLGITGGLIAHYRDRGNVRATLWQVGGASATGERETLVAEDRSVPPDGEERLVTLRAPEPGLYRLEISDGNDRTRVRPVSGPSLVVPSTLEAPMSRIISIVTSAPP